jgi:hypothetical protein
VLDIDGPAPTDAYAIQHPGINERVPNGWDDATFLPLR